MNIDMKVFGVIFLFVLVSIASADWKKNWWKTTIIYEIYIPSFKDSDGDGFGDLRGVISMLDHFNKLGVETLYLSPFFPSPMLDFGYDISNFTDINPLYGTLQDFHELIAQAKARKLQVIGDLVINHSSDEHEWFKKSVKNIHPYNNYYLWADPKGFDRQGIPIPPNNWLSIFGGSGWKWNEERKQFYFHQFSEKQPDFNLREPHLQQEIKDILKFWFDKGLAGFRADATRHFLEDEQLRDEPVKNPGKIMADLGYYDLDHKYTTDLWETYEFLHDVRKFIDDYNRNDGFERIFIAEAYTSVNYTMAYYGTDDYHIMHFPFNFKFVGLKEFKNATEYEKIITSWLYSMPQGATPNWMAENHDNPRTANRLSSEYMNIMTTTIMMLPGVACIYYGEEIGMKDIPVRADQRKDPNNDGFGTNRDPERLPMQWDDSLNAGFTSRLKSWLPVNPDYWKVNVQTQIAEEYGDYHLFRTLAAIRNSKTMKYGHFQSHIISEWVYAFVRAYQGHETYITILNLGTETELVNIHSTIRNLPSILEVAATSLNAGFEIGQKVRTKSRFPRMFAMRPLSAVVLSTKLSASSDVDSRILNSAFTR